MTNDRKARWMESMLARFGGDKEKLKEHMSTIGKRGGQSGHEGKGFAADRKRASLAGARGGAAPRRKRERRNKL